MCHKSHKNLSVGGRLTKPWQRLRDTSTPQWGPLSINEENMCQWWTFPGEWPASYNFVQKNSWWCAGSQKEPEWGKKKRQKEDGVRKCHPALLTKKNSNPMRPLSKWSFLEDTGTVTSGVRLTQHSKKGTSYQQSRTLVVVWQCFGRGKGIS